MEEEEILLLGLLGVVRFLGLVMFLGFRGCFR